MQGYTKPSNLSETDITTSLKTITCKLTSKYENVILKEDFNTTTSNPLLSQFLDTSALSPLNIDPNCFQNSKNWIFIDLLLTNFKSTFMKRNVFPTGICDHHKMISTIMKLPFTKERPKAKYYQDYRQLDSTFCSFKENEDCKELKEFKRFHNFF